MTEEIVRLLELAAGCVWNLVQHDDYYNDDGREMMLRAARDAMREAVELLEANDETARL